MIISNICSFYFFIIFLNFCFLNNCDIKAVIVVKSES
jgi:hypothetical protein